MKSKERLGVGSSAPRALVGVALVLAMLLVTVVAISARSPSQLPPEITETAGKARAWVGDPGQIIVNGATLGYDDGDGNPQPPMEVEDPLRIVEPPPTWKPPAITKVADKTRMSVGESVRFTIAVVSPSAPDNQVTWYDVVVTDEIDPAFRFRIGDVGVTPPADDVTITGNTVVVTVDSLDPGEAFVITIDCTLVGPAEPGQVIENTATLEYDDPDGNPQPPIEPEEPVEILVVAGIHLRLFVPLVLRNAP